MTPLSNALDYAARGWRVFPALRKDRPLVKWKDAATTDEAIITAWWKRWPKALVGLPTGEAFAVLDIDVKDSPTGFDKLEALGFPFAFSTPTVHTPSGGSHGYFAVPDPPIRNTNGQRGRGIGPQLDWRACGGYVIAPSPGSGYEWDPHLGIDTPMLEVPEALLPKETSSHKPGTPPEAVPGLSAYGQAALDGAGRDILAAPHGEQEATLNGRCYWIGQLSAWGEIPRTFALDVLRYAARQLVCYDPSRPWSTLELERKVNTAFAAGMRHPRGPRHG